VPFDFSLSVVDVAPDKPARPANINLKIKPCQLVNYLSCQLFTGLAPESLEQESKRAQDARLVSTVCAMVGQAQSGREPTAAFLHQGGGAVVRLGPGLDVIAHVKLLEF
jgi:hypothetical protein